MSMTPPPLPFEADPAETIPSDEAEDIAGVVAALRRTLAQSAAISGHRQRDVHVKSHGCARGELHVLPNLPAELAEGLFARPAVYPLVVRFSNANSQPQPDALPDGRGMAVKVEVPGPDGSPLVQDFVMANHPVFLAKDVKDYRRLNELRAEAGDRPTSAVRDVLETALRPDRWPLKELGSIARVAGKVHAQPLAITYYSMVPFRFGRSVVKYRALPLTGHDGTLLGRLAELATDGSAMRTNLRNALAQDRAIFEFQVQRRTSSASMPVEDATVEWPELESPYRTVAQIVLFRQDVADTPLDRCNDLAFNVWNTLPEHRPLGGINRVRHAAYSLSQAFRGTGGAARAEP